MFLRRVFFSAVAVVKIRFAATLLAGAAINALFSTSVASGASAPTPADAGIEPSVNAPAQAVAAPLEVPPAEIMGSEPALPQPVETGVPPKFGKWKVHPY